MSPERLDPLNVPEAREGSVLSPAPPGMSADRWVRLTAHCRRLDGAMNAGKVLVNPSESHTRSTTIKGENPVLPASLPTTGELADTYKEGST